MESISRAPRTPLEFRVNGLVFSCCYLERCAEDPAKVEVIIQHRLLGRFHLHEEFVLELKTGSSEEWRRVTLEELKAALLEAAGEHPHIQINGDEKGEDLPSQSEPFPSRGFPIFSHIPVEGDDSHLQRARKAFSVAGEPFRIVGGLDSRNRCSGHQSVNEARKLLSQAEFLQSRESKYELLDSRNGWKIRLLPDSNQSHGAPRCDLRSD